MLNRRKDSTGPLERKIVQAEGRITADPEWDLEIRPGAASLGSAVREILGYRYLFWVLTQRDVIVRYRQTILGPAWYLINPLLNALVFFLVFTLFVRLPVSSVPPFLFYLTGTTIWAYFSSTFTYTSNVLMENYFVFSKVYFPRLIIPSSVIASNSVMFLSQLVVMLGFIGFFILTGSEVQVTLYVLLLPVLFMILSTLALGLGLLASALVAKYRDLRNVVTFLLQLGMFVCPVVYPASTVPEQWRSVYLLNPVASTMETFRLALLGTGFWSLSHLVIGVIVSVLSLFLGAWVYTRVAADFVDCA